MSGDGETKGRRQASSEIDKFYIKAVADGEANWVNQLWLIVRSLKIQVPRAEYVLNQRDVVRLGRVVLRVGLETGSDKASAAWASNFALHAVHSHL